MISAVGLVPVAQPLFHQHHSEQGPQVPRQMAFGDLQGGDCTASVGNLCQFSCHPYSMQALPSAQREPPVLQLMILACSSGTGHH